MTNKILSWRTVDVGHEITGVFQGALEGQRGAYGVLVTEPYGAHVRFGLPRLLAERLSVVEVGTRVTIVLRGSRESKAGMTYFLFDVVATPPSTHPPAPAA